MLDWTSAANGALLVRPETPQRRLRTGPQKKLGMTLESEKTKSGRIYRIVRAKTSAPSPSALGTAEQGDA